MKNSKNNKTKGIIIIIIGILIIAATIFYAFQIDKKTPKYFNSYKENAAEKIYEEISEKNFETDYPDSIEEVMDFYNNTLLMIYGNMLLDNEKLEEIITIQRKLYTEELISKNTIEDQYKKVVENLETIKKDEMYTIGIDIVSVLKSSESECSVKVNQFVNTLGMIEWDYYLKKDDKNRWKINSWNVAKKEEIKK